MKRIARTLGITCVLTTIAACQVTQSPVEQLFAEPQSSWSLTYPHQQPGHFETLLDSLLLESQQSDNANKLDHLLYYLRSYYYFAADNTLTEQQQQKLQQALLNIAQSSLFKGDDQQALRLQEHYLVTLYLFFADKDMHAMVADHGSTLLTLSNKIPKTALSQASQQQQFTAWETFRAIAFLAYEGRRNEIMKQSLPVEALANSMLDIAASQQQDNWSLQHSIWAVAYLHAIAEQSVQTKIDQRMQRIFEDAGYLNLEQKQFLFSNRYLTNSYRVQDECQEQFAKWCHIPTIDQALPINHRCSDTLFIRANQMTEQQLQTSCEKLTSQETHFHQLLNTQRQPTKDDYNQSLRVVIFDNYTQYNQFGSLTFNIHTNNGGMYIEGEPEKKDNQATFFSFEAFWERPDFSVWNLNHEYIHYLDGRFVKYGGFGHFPSKLVWWSEGLAEYVSVGDNNPKAFELLKETPADKWPTLSQEFATTYDDGLDRTYRWSYFAIRFLAEIDLDNFQALANDLKQNDFTRYEKRLAELAEKHQANYFQWLTDHAEKYPIPEKAQRTEPRKLYRYLYRDYLMPQSLQFDQNHRHFESF